MSEKNTFVQLCQNTHLDMNYNNCIYFEDLNSRQSYFDSCVVIERSKYSFQRISSNTIRISADYNTAMHCDYIVINNDTDSSTSGEEVNSYFGFITNIKYINDSTIDIEYELDLITTYLMPEGTFITLGECLVDRQHSEKDTYFYNTVPENLSVGELASQYEEYFPSSADDLEYVVMLSCDDNGNATYGVTETLDDKTVLSGLNVIEFADADACKSWLKKNKDEVYTYVQSIRLALSSGRYEVTIKKPTALMGYTPKNKKLLTFPYIRLSVSNQVGAVKDYRIERFIPQTVASGSTMDFEIYSCALDPSVGAYCLPTNYVFSAGTFGANGDQSISLPAFPQMSWNSRYYDYWLANILPQRLLNMQTATSPMLFSTLQGAVSGGTTALANGGSVGSGAAYGAISGAASGMVQSLKNMYNQSINIINEGYSAAIQSPNTVGNCQGAVNFWADTLGLCFQIKSITSEQAKIYDDFFTKFGYKQGRIMTPNLKARPNWTYIKTSGAVVYGKAPASVLKEISDILDNGVTFWTNGANIGNYELDNSPES